MIFLVLILVIVFVFLSVDLFIFFDEWQSRIHIGRWIDRKEWQQTMEKRAIKWLKHPPTVRLTVQERLVLWDIIRGKYRSSTIQTWQDAGLIMGLGKPYALEYVQSHKGLLNKRVLLPEDLLLAYVLKKNGCLSDLQEKQILNSFQEVKEQGTIHYRPWVTNIRFVDTIGMVLPFLHACGWDDLAKRQIEEYDQAMLNGIFPAHAYDVKKKLPLGVYDWGRGIGWYILGLTEAHDLEGNEERICHLAKALLPLQREDGGFSCFMFNQQERVESSGTVLAGLLFVCAYRITQEKKYLDAANRVEKVLMKSTRRNGALDYCQGDTYGIGYYSHIFSVMPFAQGLALKLSKELDQYCNENA